MTTPESQADPNCPECTNPPPHRQIDASANHPPLMQCVCGATWWAAVPRAHSQQSPPPMGEVVEITTVASGKRMAYFSDERGWWWIVPGKDEQFLPQQVTSWRRVTPTERPATSGATSGGSVPVGDPSKGEGDTCEPCKPRIAELREHWRTAAICHGLAIERYGAVCTAVMQSIADGKPITNVLEIIGDSLNACDHVDDEGIALWERAKVVATAKDVLLASLPVECGPPAVPVEGQTTLELTQYERDNLLALLKAVSGWAGQSGLRVGNTGDWVMQIGNKLNPSGPHAGDWGRPNRTAEELVQAAEEATARVRAEAIAHERQRIAAMIGRDAETLNAFAPGCTAELVAYLIGNIAGAAGSVPAANSEPVDEVRCPNCEAMIRARMSDAPAATPPAEPLNLPAMAAEALADELLRDLDAVDPLRAGMSGNGDVVTASTTGDNEPITGQRVTDEQLTDIEARIDRLEVTLAEHPEGGCPPVCEIGAAVADDARALIADFRESRAREADQQAVIVNTDSALRNMAEALERARAERDGLQQRIDKALALCARGDAEHRPPFAGLVHSDQVRAALSGTEVTDRG